MKIIILSILFVLLSYYSGSAQSTILPDVPTTQDTVTIMIVYTPAAAAWSAEHETNIDTTIAKVMRESNLVLQMSRTFLTLKLVHTELVNYIELNNSNDLFNLKNQNDGFMDNIHPLRDSYCGDLVLLLANICYVGGEAFTLRNLFGVPDSAFSIVAVSKATYQFSLRYAAIHEIGHNMGCRHHPLQYPQPIPPNFAVKKYSYGWRWIGDSYPVPGTNTVYCSVMTEQDIPILGDPPGTPRPTMSYFFSNPDIINSLGNAIGYPDSADNARSIREIKSIIAAYREGCCPTIQTTGLTFSSITDTASTISWTRGNGNSVLVIAREDSAVNSFPAYGTTYSANNIFGSGAQLGIGNFVVYNGAGTSVNITKLKVGTAYHFAIYEYKTDNKCYLSPALTGNNTTPSLYCAAGSNGLPNVMTAPATIIRSYTATTGGTVSCDAGATITARGVCYSLHSVPTFSDNYTNEGADTGTFISNLTGLIPDTVYYVRAYVMNSQGTAYGNEITFRTVLYYLGDWVYDYDNNLYSSIVLGTQQWLGWNLRVTHYNNGDLIPNIPLGSYWYNASSGAWANGPLAFEIYGCLYNWYAVADSRNLCPTGWHVPTDGEWTILINYLGGSSVAGGKLKETGTSHWNSPNTGASNRSGLTALPGGYAGWNFIDYYVTFYSVRDYGYFWTSTETSTTSSRFKLLGKNTQTIGGGTQQKYIGQSVRCIKN
jgi:uncharacterized protein (TIGR02145 family)